MIQQLPMYKFPTTDRVNGDESSSVSKTMKRTCSRQNSLLDSSGNSCPFYLGQNPRIRTGSTLNLMKAKLTMLNSQSNGSLTYKPSTASTTVSTGNSSPASTAIKSPDLPLMDDYFFHDFLESTISYSSKVAVSHQASRISYAKPAHSSLFRERYPSNAASSDMQMYNLDKSQRGSIANVPPAMATTTSTVLENNFKVSEMGQMLTVKKQSILFPTRNSLSRKEKALKLIHQYSAKSCTATPIVQEKHSIEQQQQQNEMLYRKSMPYDQIENGESNEGTCVELIDDPTQGKQAISEPMKATILANYKRYKNKPPNYLANSVYEDPYALSCAENQMRKAMDRILARPVKSAAAVNQQKEIVLMLKRRDSHLREQLKESVAEIVETMREYQNTFTRNLLQIETINISWDWSLAIIEKIIATKSTDLLVEFLLFLGECALAVEALDKAGYFIQQANQLIDMSIYQVGRLKSSAYVLLGNLSMALRKYSEALLLYKKALQYVWYYSQDTMELEVYDRIGLAAFYMQDVQKAMFYHTKYAKGLHEEKHSYARVAACEETHQYYIKSEYNQKWVTPIVMVQLQLPINYSIQQNLKEEGVEVRQRRKSIDDELIRESADTGENFRLNRLKAYQSASAVKVLEAVMESRDMQYRLKLDMSNAASLLMEAKKGSWISPVMRKGGYDTSSLGPVMESRPSKRVFEDMTKYRLTIEEKIAVMKKLKPDLGKVMLKVDETVKDKKNNSRDLNMRVRISHGSPNRFDAYRYDTPFNMMAAITRAFNRILEKIAGVEIQIIQENYNAQ